MTVHVKAARRGRDDGAEQRREPRVYSVADAQRHPLVLHRAAANELDTQVEARPLYIVKSDLYVAHPAWRKIMKGAQRYVDT
jgi:hypothetical protein